MRPSRSRVLRPIGGLTGVVIAIAGGFGVAVGTYSLPDPTSLRAENDAYVRVDQRAMAVWKIEDQDGYRELRIEATRGASAEAAADAGIDGAGTRQGRDTNAYFRAQLLRCSPGDECTFEEWRATLAPDAIEFDPAMGGAHFAGVADCNPETDCDAGTTCTFDVEWTAGGIPAPFEQRQADVGLHPRGMDEKVEGFAEVSRVAPAGIQSTCAGETEEAPGYLSMGLRRTIVGRGGVRWSTPEDDGGQQ